MKAAGVGFVLLLLLGSTAVPAATGSFMTKSVIASMEDEDRALLMETLTKGVEEAPDGANLAWKNDKTGNSGTMKILDTHADYGTTCRSFKITNLANGRTGGGQHRMCKASDGSWRLAAKRIAKPAPKDAAPATAPASAPTAPAP